MTTTSQREIAASVLSYYPDRFRAAHIHRMVPGFSGAFIAEVRIAAGDGCSDGTDSADRYCLRGWPPDSLPTERIRGLHQLLQHVRNQGVDCVSVPLFAGDGSTLVRHGSRFWQLEPWMPGEADFWSNPSHARLRAAMRCLATWHRAAVSFQPASAVTAWLASHKNARSPAVVERLARIAELLRRGGHKLSTCLKQAGQSEFRDLGTQIFGLFVRTAPYVAVRLEAASQTLFVLQPCLRDVWHDHVLFTGDEVTGLIDPSACRSENVATDLARLLGSLIDDDQNLWDMALDEYQRFRPLTPDELTLIPVLDSSSVLLSGLTWLDRFCTGDQRIAGDNRVIDRLKTILSRLEFLAKGVR